MNIILRGEDDTILLRPGVDFREPGQRAPWERKPISSDALDEIFTKAYFDVVGGDNQ